MVKKINNEFEDLKKDLQICLAENKKLKIIADYDKLTGVYNRHGFIREAEKFLHDLIKSPERRNFSIPAFSFIFVDLDGLKTLNDKYGHNIGDKFILSCAKVFKKHLRDIDIVGRWGGDEFIIGLVGTTKDGAYKAAEKLRKAINGIRIAGVKGHKFSGSFGVFSFETVAALKKASLAKLIAKSDKAMYIAKKKLGKNAVYAPGKINI